MAVFKKQVALWSKYSSDLVRGKCVVRIMEMSRLASRDVVKIASLGWHEDTLVHRDRATVEDPAAASGRVPANQIRTTKYESLERRWRN